MYLEEIFLKTTSEIIDRIWLGSTYNTSKINNFEIIPDGCVDLVFELSQSSGTSYLFGTTTELKSFEAKVDCEYIGVRFRPGKAPFINDLSIKEITNCHCELITDKNINLSEILESLNSCSDFFDKKNYLESLVRDFVPFKVDTEINFSVDYILNKGGNFSVKVLSSLVGKSERQIERRFERLIGVSPKQFGKIIRLQNTLKVMKENTSIKSSELAYYCGYYDQSHLIRDFKKLTSKLPHPKNFL